MTKLTEEGREARREYQRRYRAEHREEISRRFREYQRRYRAQHREEINRKRRERYAANKEREKAKRDEYWERRALREAEYREPNRRAALLATALRELAAFRRKYQQLDELADIFAAIDAKEADK